MSDSFTLCDRVVFGDLKIYFLKERRGEGPEERNREECGDFWPQVVERRERGSYFLVCILVSSLLDCVPLGKTSDCLGLFPHLYSGAPNGPCIIRLSDT